MKISRVFFVVLLMVTGGAFAQSSTNAVDLSGIESRIEALILGVQSLRANFVTFQRNFTSAVEDRDQFFADCLAQLAEIADLIPASSANSNSVDFASVTNLLEDIDHYLTDEQAARLQAIQDTLSSIEDYAVYLSTLDYSVSGIWQDLGQVYSMLDQIFYQWDGVFSGQWSTQEEILSLLSDSDFASNAANTLSVLRQIYNSVEEINLKMDRDLWDFYVELTNATLRVDLGEILPILRQISGYDQSTAYYASQIYSSLLQAVNKISSIDQTLSNINSYITTFDGYLRQMLSYFMRWDKLYTDYFNSSFDSAGWSNMRKYFIDYYDEGVYMAAATEESITNMSFNAWQRLNYFQRVSCTLWRITNALNLMQGSGEDFQNVANAGDQLSDRSQQLNDSLDSQSSDISDSGRGLVSSMQSMNNALNRFTHGGNRVVVLWEEFTLFGNSGSRDSPGAGVSITVPRAAFDMDENPVYTGIRSGTRNICIVIYAAIFGCALLACTLFVINFAFNISVWLWRSFSEMKIEKLNFPIFFGG